MTGREIIKEIMKEQGLTNNVFAKRLGITQAALWDRLDTTPRTNKPRKDIPLTLLADMLKMLDYKVVIVPSNKKIDGGFEVETTLENNQQNT